MPADSSCAIHIRKGDDLAIIDGHQENSSVPSGTSIQPPEEQPLGFFDRVPWEIRRDILVGTNQVAQNASKHGNTEVRIGYNRRTKQFYFERHGDPFDGPDRFPNVLFNVSKQMRYEAFDVLFRENRIILDFSFAQALDWLKSVPRESLKAIRKLDIDLKVENVPGDVLRYEEVGGGSEDFEALIKFIAAHCRKDRLFLSMVTDFWGIPFHTRRVTNRNHCDFWVPLAEAVRRHLCPGLARFHVYDYGGPHLERLIEKIVMGGKYHSNALGKVKKSLRYENRRYNPHIMYKHYCDKQNLEWRPSPEDDGKGPAKNKLSEKRKH